MMESPIGNNQRKMKMSNIGYHTRLYADNARKITGGSFSGSLDIETANRLVKSSFTVSVKHSGTCVFVDREGREVRLYITVDADATTEGQLAKKLWLKEREIKEEVRRLKAQTEEEEIERLTADLSHDEIVRRLKGD
jgi:hypothetical protein